MSRLKINAKGKVQSKGIRSRSRLSLKTLVKIVCE